MHLILIKEIEKFDLIRKVFNKQFIEKLKAIFILNKTQFHTPTDCFTLKRDHQQEFFKYNIDRLQIEFDLNKFIMMVPSKGDTVCRGV